MDLADIAVVYYSKHALELKRLPYFDHLKVLEAFGRDDIHVFNETESMTKFLLNQSAPETSFLMMSSGDYDGLKLNDLTELIFSKSVSI